MYDHLPPDVRGAQIVADAAMARLDDLVSRVKRLENLMSPEIKPPRQMPLVEWPDTELVGLTEIAGRLGVDKDTPDKWRHRKVLPNELRIISGTPVWEWKAIKEWAALGRWFT
jgi:hypothetical protein